MKKYFLSIVAALFLNFNVYAQDIAQENQVIQADIPSSIQPPAPLKTAYTNKFQTTTNISYLQGDAIGNHYNRAVLNNVIEYSLPYKMSVGNILQLSQIDSEYNGGTKEYAWNSIEFWHRYRFYNDDFVRLNVQNLYKFPGNYEVNRNIGLGKKQQDYELRLLADFNAKEGLTNALVHRSSKWLLRYEIAYRRRFDNTFDELRSALTLSYRVHENVTLLFQGNVAYSIFSKRQAGANDNTVRNFSATNDMNNVSTFSALYHMNDKYALQFGYVRRIGGSNTTHDQHGVMAGVLGAF